MFEYEGTHLQTLQGMNLAAQEIELFFVWDLIY